MELAQWQQGTSRHSWGQNEEQKPIEENYGGWWGGGLQETQVSRVNKLNMRNQKSVQ